MDDLLKLAKRVEAGEITGHDLYMAFNAHTGEIEKSDWVAWRDAIKSLDAAKALHDAVLPGWLVRLQFSNATATGDRGFAYATVKPDNVIRSPVPAEKTGKAYNPAAAWVAAIIRAKAGME